MRRPALLVLLCLLLLPTPAVRSGEGEVKLLTDETIPLYLSRGRELARNQQWETMIDVLQRIVIGDPKVFSDLKAEVLNAAVYSEDGVLYYPARELCIKELAAMPPEGLRAYRTRYDNAARDLYAQARRTPDVEKRIAAYGRVFDAWLVSSVGDDALLASGDLNLELGRYYEALALYRRLVEVYPKDTDRDLAYIADKTATLRIFEDPHGKMNLNIQQAAGQILLVPAFTLLADARKGRRPSFDQAAEPQLAESLYLTLVERLKTMEIDVKTGQFQATMQVTATNTGPVLTLLDSRKLF